MLNSAITSNWSIFSPRDYLREYYADVGAENLAILRFLMRSLRAISPDSVLLEFGGGPTVYTLIAASTYANEIHFCDYLESNLEEVRKWLCKDHSAFNWTQFIKTTLVLEGKDYSFHSVTKREDEVRARVKRIMRCDANRRYPIDQTACQYDVLVTNFCAESATTDRRQWNRFVRNITSLIKPGGQIIMSALKGADSYAVGQEVFPAVHIMEEDLIEALCEAGFVEDTIRMECVSADRPSRHYQGLMFTTAIKSS